MSRELRMVLKREIEGGFLKGVALPLSSSPVATSKRDREDIVQAMYVCVHHIDADV